MEIFDHFRFELLLEMAEHFGRDLSKRLTRQDILSTERKCLIQIYEHMKLGDSVNAEVDGSHDCLIPYRDLVQSQLSYPYLENIMGCQQELWRLFLYYDDAIRSKEVLASGVRERQQLILQLLLMKRLGHDDVMMARKLVEWATLRHLYFPLVGYSAKSKQLDLDTPPF